MDVVWLVGDVATGIDVVWLAGATGIEEQWLVVSGWLSYVAKEEGEGI